MSDSASLPAPISEPVRPALNYRGLYHFTTLPSSTISIPELRRLYRELSERTAEGLERELSMIKRPSEMAAEEFESILERARKIGTLTVTVVGSTGERATASSAEVLEDDKLPETITRIVFDSAAAIQTENVTPLNRFKLTLDFTEPPGFAVYNPWSQPTPNDSHLEVVGPDSTWVTAVHQSTLAFFTRRKKHRDWLHNPYTFNMLNYLVGFPGALWIIYRIDTKFSFVVSGIHSSLRGILYIYLFLLALLVFRTTVWGFRWILPLIEIEGSRSIKARLGMGAMLGSLFLALVYDVLKTILT